MVEMHYAKEYYVIEYAHFAKEWCGPTKSNFYGPYASMDSAKKNFDDLIDILFHNKHQDLEITREEYSVSDHENYKVWYNENGVEHTSFLFIHEKFICQ